MRPLSQLNYCPKAGIGLGDSGTRLPTICKTTTRCLRSPALPAIRDSETVGGVATGRAGRLADSTGVPNLWLVGLGRGSENVTTTGADYPFGIWPFAQTSRPFDAQIEP
jgi:hypothetical protein